jgi:hypothetical protein
VALPKYIFFFRGVRAVNGTGTTCEATKSGGSLVYFTICSHSCLFVAGYNYTHGYHLRMFIPNSSINLCSKRFSEVLCSCPALSIDAVQDRDVETKTNLPSGIRRSIDSF